jgi:hypothetical protein
VKQRLLIVLFTALVFGAGFGAHMWIANDETVPPPPAAIGSEFAHGPGTPAAAPAVANQKGTTPGARGERDEPLNRTRLMGEIQRYSSQIKTYQTRLDELDTEFDRDLLPLLTAAQRGHYSELQKRAADHRAKGEAAIAAETAPLSDQQIFRLQQRPLFGVLSSVSISMRFDQLKRELKLVPDQETKVRELLVARRKNFLALIDATPPPSITLSRLALHAAQLGAEPAKKTEAAK